jgi:putative oxidoreductase
MLAVDQGDTMAMRKLLITSAPSATVLVGLAVGLIFLSEGIRKFLFPESVGAGRFAKIGFAAPEFMAAFVACFEIACGLLVILGLVRGLAVVPLVVTMMVAVATTKLPILRESGFWKATHESRTDFSILLGSVFLFIVGAGLLSLDRCLAKWTKPPG